MSDEVNPYGEGVVRVSSVLDAVQWDEDSDALLHWSAWLARKGKQWQVERDHAAGVGTAAHVIAETMMLDRAWESGWITSAFERDSEIENYLAAGRNFGDAIPPPGGEVAVKSAVSSFVDFADEYLRGHDVEIVSIERKMIWESCMTIGGTADAIIVRDGKVEILDWKTSNAIRPRYRVQLAAYLEGALACGIISDHYPRLVCVRIDKRGQPYDVHVDENPATINRLRRAWDQAEHTYAAMRNLGMR
jgi:hypothetical protein